MGSCGGWIFGCVFGVVVVQAVVVGLRGVCGCWLGFVGLSLLVCGFEFCDFVVLI